MSDLARVYASGKEPGLFAGSAAASAAHADEVEKPGTEKATTANANLAHDFKDDRAR